MIRVTETGHRQDEADIRIEGNLDPEGLGVIGQMLTHYARLGVSRVHAQADGIVSVDVHALQRWPWPAAPELVFRTTRLALCDQFGGAGVRIELVSDCRLP